MTGPLLDSNPRALTGDDVEYVCGVCAKKSHDKEEMMKHVKEVCSKQVGMQYQTYQVENKQAA